MILFSGNHDEHRHIIAIKDIQKGDIFTDSNIAILESDLDVGIKARYWAKVINKKSLANINCGMPILAQHI